jgi:hypothetical protein
MDAAPERDRPQASGVHRRDVDEDQHGAAARLGAERRTTGGESSSRPLANHDLRRLSSSRPHRHDRIEAPWLIDGPTDGEGFRTYVEKALAPTLNPGDLVIMDMCGRPHRCKKNLFEEGGAWSGADMCPASCCGLSHAAGPYGSSRSGSNSISRAQGAYP